MDEEEAQARRRPLAARLGVSLLNLAAPGAGLIRIGHDRAGFAFVLTPLAYFLLFAATAALLPTLTPHGFVAASIISVLVALFVLIGPVVATWRHSRAGIPNLPWWRRWYSLLALILIFQLARSQLAVMVRGFYRPFYLPSSGMEPTLPRGDRLVADMWRVGPPRRGEVVLVQVGDAIYVKRVAAVAGDRIAMAGGVPVVNGIAAVQHHVGATRQSDWLGGAAADILAERLPGEQSEHRILDSGPQPYDDMPEVTVPPGHFFVLGDNRGYSADSRVPREQMGVGMAPVADLKGRPLFRTWTANWRWLGLPVR